MDIKYELIDIACSEKVKPNLFSNQYRYAALNYSALMKYGSLEFRALRTPTDLSDIPEWVRLFGNLKNNSKRLFKDPSEVIDYVSEWGHEEFAKKVLGSSISLMKEKREIEDDIQSGVWNIQSFGYCTNWR